MPPNAESTEYGSSHIIITCPGRHRAITVNWSTHIIITCPGRHRAITVNWSTYIVCSAMSTLQLHVPARSVLQKSCPSSNPVQTYPKVCRIANSLRHGVKVVTGCCFMSQLAVWNVLHVHRWNVCVCIQNHGSIMKLHLLMVQFMARMQKHCFKNW